MGIVPYDIEFFVFSNPDNTKCILQSEREDRIIFFFLQKGFNTNTSFTTESIQFQEMML